MLVDQYTVQCTVGYIDLPLTRSQTPLSLITCRQKLVERVGRISGLGGLCLRFHPKCSKFGTVLHLGPKILGKIKIKICGVKGTVFLTIENVKNGIL